MLKKTTVVINSRQVFGNFVDMLANLLGLGGVKENGVVTVEPNIYTDDTSIKVVVNDNFFKVLGGLIPQLKNVSLPDEIGDIILSINTSEVGLDSVTVRNCAQQYVQVAVDLRTAPLTILIRRLRYVWE